VISANSVCAICIATQVYHNVHEQIVLTKLETGITIGEQ